MGRVARVDSQAVVSKLQQTRSCSCEHGSQVLQEGSQSGTSASDSDHLLATGRLRDRLGSVCDESHADGHCWRTVSRTEVTRGRMTLLATRVRVNQTECGFHLIACASNTLKRVCRSTVTAETYQIRLGVETSDRLRAAVVNNVHTLIPGD